MNGNMILGKDYEVSMDSHITHLNNNIIVVGASGAGKTRGFVLPNIEQCCGSYVISDSKGLLYDKYKKHLEDNGYLVKKIDFTHPENSDRFNFFDYIETSTDVVKVANMLIQQENNAHVDPFWNEAAQLLLESLISYLVEVGKKEEMNFENLMLLLGLADISSDFPDDNSPLDSLMRVHGRSYEDSFAVSTYKKVKIASGRTLRSIFITVNAHLGLYNTKEICNMMSKDEICIKSIGQRKTAVFVVVSDTCHFMDNLATLTFSMILHELCRYADTCPDGRLPVDVRIIYDDFATSCKIYDMPRIASCIRSRGISVAMLLQSEEQLEDLYGKSGGRTIISNCDTYIFMGCNDADTCISISRRCDIPLDKILFMPIGKSWVFRRGQRPKYVTIYSYDENM